MTTQHTPTPYCTMHASTVIRGFDGSDVAIVEKADDCRFIVRACNAHDELVAALQAIAEAAQYGIKDADVRAECGEIARAALAKVSK